MNIERMSEIEEKWWKNWNRRKYRSAELSTLDKIPIITLYWPSRLYI